MKCWFLCLGYSLSVLSWSALSWAAPLGKKNPSLTLQWDSKAPTRHWLFEKDQIYSGPKRLNDLALVKKYELQERYEECAAQILRIWNKYPAFWGWMSLQGTRCLLSQMKFASIQDGGLYKLWWKHLTRHGENLLWGVWSADLLKATNEWVQEILKNSKLPARFKSQVAEYQRQNGDSLGRADRLEIYKVIVEGLREEGASGFGQELALREGLVKANKELESTGSTPQGISQGTPQGTGNPAVTNGVLAKKNKESEVRTLTEEEDLYQKFLEATKASQLTGAAELGVLILDKYPNGLKSSLVFEKLMQAYFSVLDSTESPEQKAQIERCLETVRLLHSSRLTEWARASHRRADFLGAYQLAKQALSDEEKSVDGAALLFMVGRSAYFMGRYREAIEFFDRLIRRHSGYSEFWEIKFRRAQALVRLGEEAKAEEAFGELAMAPENKSYGLSSLYWLIRLKQKRKANVEEWLTIMRDRYSLTYFGLRLSAEANQQKVKLEDENKAVTLQKEWVLTPTEHLQWDRMQDLAQAGWYEAAQGELNNVLLNGGPEHKFLWAQQLTEIFAYPQALRLMNELTDLEPRWRKASYLKIVYPKPFRQIIEAEAQKNGIHPHLVYSLIRQESAFLLVATSRSQAKGLMQLIPPTANEVAQDLKIKKFDSDQMYHPIINLKFGIHYLAKVIRLFGGNVSIGLAAYNAGPQRLRKFFEARSEVRNPALLSQEDPWSDFWIEELPWLETNLYVKSILRNRVLYQILDSGSFEWSGPVWKDLFQGIKK